MTARRHASEWAPVGTAWFQSLFDDAALFPPGNAAMADALEGHLAWKASAEAAYVGAFVCSDARWPELVKHLPTASRIKASVTVPGGMDGLSAAVAAASNTPKTTLVAVEVPLLRGQRVAALTTQLDRELPAHTTGYLEVPVGEVDHALCRSLALTRHRLKLRTGGTTATAFPTENELAAAIGHATLNRLSFKLTAGLHHAVRHRDPVTGFEHHGFLNVLLATSAVLAGSPASSVASILADRNPASVAEAFRRLDAETTHSVRRQFESFGTCSIDEPLDDLTALGLIEETRP
ncbi:hypothetical protein [Streptomyces sp. NPDC029041]|uniref:hypothetical protein n=1 Tax=Streptomyces sp. NPDC029041 TaxID=3155727 RepID=UPI0033BFF013